MGMNLNFHLVVLCGPQLVGQNSETEQFSRTECRNFLNGRNESKQCAFSEFRGRAVGLNKKRKYIICPRPLQGSTGI
jgi:hypothetical protein